MTEAETATDFTPNGERLQAWRQLAETQPLEAVLARIYQDYAADLAALGRQIEALQAALGRQIEALQAAQRTPGEAADHERRLLRTIIDNIPDQIFARDRDCRFTLSNRRDAQVMGVADPETLVGKRDEDFYPPDLAARYQADDRRVMETGEALRDYEEPSLGPGGQPRWTLTNKVPLRDSHGEVIGLVGVARDITAYKLAEAEIRRLNADLERRVADRTAELSARTAELAAANESLRQEIAERRQAEEKFLRVFHVNPDAIAVSRLSDGGYLAVNEGYARVLGYTAADVEGQSTLSLNIWANRDDRARLAAELVEKGAVDNVELLVRHKDGTVFPALIAARLITLDGEPCVIAFTRDIRRQKEAEALLHRQFRDLEALNAAHAALAAQLDRERTLLRTVIDTLPDQIFAHDRDGGYILNNRSDAAILGVADPERLRGRHDQDFYPPELAASFVADDRQVIESGEALVNREEGSVSPDGRQRWVLTTKVPLRDSQGVVVGLVGVARDITERKEADLLIEAQKEQLEAQNQELQAQNEELVAQAALVEQTEAELRRLNVELERRVAERTQELSLANTALVRAARLKDEFLASMSHELRTPLTGILGLSELLQRGFYGPLAGDQLQSVQSIQESGQHLLDLINDILDVAKIEAGKVELQLAPVRMVEVCQASLQVVQALAEKKNLRLSFSRDLAVEVIRADGRRLKQMLVNLLSNAVKFTAPGGAVSLEVTGDAARQQLQLVVADTGIGIAPADLPRLFKPFVQLDSRLSREYEGTGLGLSLVMGLAELHGGGVQVESEGVPGRGSRFIVTLPWLREVEPASGPAAPPATVHLRQALLIEDAPEAATQLTRYLAELGIASQVLGGGQGAVARAAELQPDVILLDILLPDVSGWEVLAQLRTDARTRACPVVVVSVVEARAKAEALGADGYLLKPVALSDLQAALRRGVEQAAVRRAALAPRPDAAGHEAAAARPVILLADDSEIVRSTLGTFLRAQAFQVVTASQGGEALEKAREVRPAVILMDIQMPGMDGLEAIRWLRAEPEAALAATPVIALTALAMAGDRERCLAAGANAYVPKPVSLDVLLKTIQTYLAQGPTHGI